MGKEKKNPIDITHSMIKHEGLFDFYAIDNALKTWMDKRKFYFIEKEHSEKRTGEGFEIIIEYNFSRKPDAYVKFSGSFKITIRQAEKVNVEGKGETWKGYFRMITDAEMEKNYLKKFKSSGFSNFIREIYEKYIINKRLSDYEDKLFAEVYEIINEVKDILGQPRVE